MVHETGLLVDFIGSMVGWLGVSIAVYLQLISNKDCPPKYVVIFGLFGISMIFIHSSIYFQDTTTYVTLQITAYLILAILEIVGGYRIYKNLDVKSSRDWLEEVISPR